MFTNVVLLTNTYDVARTAMNDDVKQEAIQNWTRDK